MTGDQMDAKASPQEQASTAVTSVRRAGLALGLLTLANAFNLADRMLLGIVQEPMRLEFGLSDFQLGLLGGSAFAVLYGLLSIPIARLADRSNRITIASVALGIWSGMTALCGMAGNFVQILLARAGVSVGEAGAVAPSLSFLSDVFSAKRRATAMAVFSIGGPAGALMATFLGGWITQEYGWRAAFIAFGTGGLVLALVIRLALREVRTDAHSAQPVRFLEGLRTLARKRSYIHVCIAGIYAAFCATFIMQYMTSFLMRVHGLPVGRAALIVGLAGGIFGMAGTFSAGWLADRLGRNRPGARTMVLAVTFAVAAIALGTAWWMPLALAIPLLFVGAAAMNAYPGISFAVSSMIAPSNLRATSIAIFTVAGNLIGYALGPPILGAISDAAAARAMRSLPITPDLCDADPTQALCIAAQGDGLRWALTVASLLLLGGAVHHLRASRTLARDIEE